MSLVKRNEVRKRLICDGIRKGLSNQKAAAAAGVSYGTLRQWMRTYDDWQRSVQKAEAERDGWRLETLEDILWDHCVNGTPAVKFVDGKPVEYRYHDPKGAKLLRFLQRLDNAWRPSSGSPVVGNSNVDMMLGILDAEDATVVEVEPEEEREAAGDE